MPGESPPRESAVEVQPPSATLPQGVVNLLPIALDPAQSAPVVSAAKTPEQPALQAEGTNGVKRKAAAHDCSNAPSIATAAPAESQMQQDAQASSKGEAGRVPAHWIVDKDKIIMQGWLSKVTKGNLIKSMQKRW